MIRFVLITITFLLITFEVIAVEASSQKTSNGFYVTDKQLDFNKTFRGINCKGKIHYPYLSNEDIGMFSETNEDIHDFAEIYSICNESDKDNFSVSYDIPESMEKNFFSVRWTTVKDGKMWRIDALTFDKDQDELVKISNVFNGLASSMLNELVKLSEGHLNDHISWDDFLNKIECRDIQFFIEKGQWVLVFNPSPSSEALVVAKIPNYFLKGDDVTD